MEHSLESDLKTSEKRHTPRRSSILIYLGLLLFIFGAFSYYRVRRLSFTKVPPIARESALNLDIPSEVIIPSLKLDLKVDPGNIYNGVWAVSANNATFATISSPPGGVGNTVIYGHNKKSIFGDLPYVSIGQKITVKTVSGKIYNYTVDKKYFVDPSRVDLVSPTNEQELTLYTCWGLFDSQRAVIKAKLQE